MPHQNLYTYNSLNQRTNETHGSAGFVGWTYDGTDSLLHRQ